jgi:GNAT superfamily N-acetyltransferase
MELSQVDTETLDRSVRAFLIGFSMGKSRTHPYITTTINRITAMHDAPRANPSLYRRAEFIRLDGEPDEIHADCLSTAAQIGESVQRWFLCSIRTQNDLEPVEREFKKIGYRLLGREAFFIHDYAKLKDPSGGPVSRLKTEEDIKEFFSWAGLRVSSQDIARVHSGEIRRYVAKHEEQIVGNVASIAAGGQTRWVQALYVHDPFRRRGFGKALMDRLLWDDYQLGNTLSVLLASKTGAKLYPRLGYRQIGTLLLYKKPASV